MPRHPSTTAAQFRGGSSDSGIDSLENGMKERDDFKCRKYGAYCRMSNGIVRISDAEIARMAAFLGMGRADFIARETELAPDCRGLVLKRRPDGACAWLTDDNLCRIAPVRPDKCRAFPLEWTNADSFQVCQGQKGMLDERTVFDTIPEQFDRWRPRYTPELFSFLVSRCSLGAGIRCLEIGPGTGQATDFALDAGCDCTVIELGANFAERLRRKYGGRPNFKLINGDFELHPFAGGSFDFVYSAATIQWIDPKIAFSKSFDILKPGGHLALFLLHGDYQTPNPALYADVQKVYDEHYRTDAPYKQRFPYLDAPKYGFESEERFSFPSSRRYTADEYVEYLHTHSDHIMLREDCKKAFYGGIRDAILRHGNTIEFRDEFVLYLCRKPVQAGRLLSFASSERPIADPRQTGGLDATCDGTLAGRPALLRIRGQNRDPLI